MLPKPNLDSIERFNKLEQDLRQIKNILKSAKPIRSVYRKPVLETNEKEAWARHYHTDEEFIKEHVEVHRFTDNGNIGFALTQDPKEKIKD